MGDLDQMLTSLSRMPAHPALDQIEASVFADVYRLAERDRRMPPRLAATATISAALLGIAGATLPAPSAATDHRPLVGISPLAPSALLLGDR